MPATLDSHHWPRFHRRTSQAVDVMKTWQAIVPAYAADLKRAPKAQPALAAMSTPQEKYRTEVQVLQKIAAHCRARETSRKLDNIASNVDLVALMLRWMMLVSCLARGCCCISRLQRVTCQYPTLQRSCQGLSGSMSSVYSAVATTSDLHTSGAGEFRLTSR